VKIEAAFVRLQLRCYFGVIRDHFLVASHDLAAPFGVQKASVLSRNANELQHGGPPGSCHFFVANQILVFYLGEQTEKLGSNQRAEET